MLYQPKRPVRIAEFNKISAAGTSLLGADYVLGKEIETPDAILVRNAHIDTGLFPTLVAIARAGAGVNTITVDKATEKGICVFNTPGANANAVAEQVMTMIGAQMRNIFDAVLFVRTLNAGFDKARLEKYIEEKKGQFVGHELAGKVLAVIGLGQIGVRVANLAVQKGMRVIGYDAYLSVRNAHQLDRKVEVVETLDRAIEKANVVTVHVPLSKDTKHLIGASQLVRMPAGVMLVNYSRGDIYDDAAVLAGLAMGQVGSYITDFPTPELIINPRVIATPHQGASTEQSEENCAVMACTQLKLFLEQGTVVNSVNFPPTELTVSPGTKTRLVVVNRNVPGVIASVTNVLGECGMNIVGSINRGNDKVGYNLIEVASEVPPEVLARIAAADNVLSVRPTPMM